MRPIMAWAVVAMLACSEEPEDFDAAPPGKTAAELLCEEIAAHPCAASSPCTTALVEDCADIASMLSDAFIASMRECLKTADSPTSCLVSSTSGLQPTASHQAFAKKFCSECALGVSGCEEAIFGGDSAELQAVSKLVLMLGDSLVDELAAECATGLTCLATFTQCAQGVLAKRGLPEATIACMIDSLLKGAPAGDCGGGAGGSGGAGESTSSTGGSSPECQPDANEDNDAIYLATLLDAADDGMLSDCEPEQSIIGELAVEDEDWFQYGGLDSPCGIDDIQPHAFVDSSDPIDVCVYLKPLGNSAPPTCLEGTFVDLGEGYTGCCGTGSARLDYGANLQNDDARVVIQLKSSQAACVPYTLTYAFGK